MSYNLGTAQGRILVDGSGAQKGFAVARAAAESFVSSVNNQTSQIQNFGKKLAVASAAGATGFGVAVTAASKFENRLSAIAAVSGATESEMDKIATAALRIGAETSFGATEAAMAFEELIKAGVSTEDALNGAADSAVAMAEAGEIDLARAAEIAASAMNNFNLEAKDLPGVADSIAGAANASAISVEDFAQSMNQVGSVANLTGISFDDMAVAIAEMGNAGIKGSDAGTSLKTMLMNLIPTTKDQIAEFKRLGLMTVDVEKGYKTLTEQGLKPLDKTYAGLYQAAEKHLMQTQGLKKGTKELKTETEEYLMKNGAMQNAFFDSAGNAKSLRDIQEELQNSMQGMTKEQKLASLELLFGADAIRAAAIMADNGAEGYDELAKSMQSVTAADVAAQRMDNLSGAIEQMKGAIETIAIRVGMLLLPALTGIVQGVTWILDKIANASEGFYQWATSMGVLGTVLGAIGAALISFVAAAGPLLFILVALRNGFNVFKNLGSIGAAFSSAASAIGGFRGILAGLGAAFMRIGQLIVPFWSIIIRLPSIIMQAVGAIRIFGAVFAVATGPIGIVVAAIGLLITAAIALYQNFEPFRTLVDSVAASIGQALAPAIQNVQTFLGQLAQAFQGVIDTLVSGNISTILTEMFNIPADHPFLGFLLSLRENFLNLVTVVQTVSAAIGTAFIGAFNSLVAVWQGTLWPALQQLGSVFTTQLLPAMQQAGATIQATLVPALAQIWAAVQPILPILGQLAMMVGGLLIGALMLLANILIGHVIPFIAQLAGAVLPMLISVIASVASFIVQYLITPFVQFVTFLTGMLIPVIQVLVGIFQAVFPVMLSIVQGVIANIIGVFQGLVQFFTGIFQIFEGIFSGNWSRIWEGVKNVFMGAVTFLWNAVQLWFVGKILGILRSVMTFIASIFRSGWSIVQNIFSTVISFIGNLVRSGFNLIRSAIQAVMNAIRAVISAVWNGIRSVFTGAVNGVRSTVTSGFNAVRSVINAVMNGIRSVISSIWNAIRGVVSNVVSSIRGFVTNGFNAMRSSAMSIMNGLRSGVQGVWNSVMSFFSSIPGKIKGIFGSAGSWLVSAGRSIIDGLLSGLKSAAGAIGSFLGSLTDKIPKMKGPPKRDAKLLTHNGELIMRSLQKGLRKEVGGVYDILQGMTSTIPMSVMTTLSAPKIVPPTMMASGIAIMEHHIEQDIDPELARPVHVEKVEINGVDTNNADEVASRLVRELTRVKRSPGTYSLKKV